MLPLERRAIRCSFLAMGACCCVTVGAQGVPTEEGAFTEFAAARIRQEVGDAPVVVKSPLTLGVGPLQANLDRVFVFCRTNTAACAPELDRYAKGVAQVLKQQGAPVDRTAVRLVVRTSQYIKRAQESFGPSGPTLQARPIVDGLVAVAVLDTPRAVRPLDERDLKALGVTQDGLFEIGQANLESSLKPLSEAAKPVTAGQIGSVGGSVYEVGRVAIPSQWAQLAQAQGGTLLLSMPTTDLVLYVSAASPEAVGALRALAKNTMSKASNPLSTAVLQWSNDGWSLVP